LPSISAQQYSFPLQVSITLFALFCESQGAGLAKSHLFSSVQYGTKPKVALSAIAQFSEHFELSGVSLQPLVLQMPMLHPEFPQEIGDSGSHLPFLSMYLWNTLPVQLLRLAQ